MVINGKTLQHILRVSSQNRGGSTRREAGGTNKADVFTELARSGIGPKYPLICATGCHGALTRLDFVKKLGEDVLKRFPVYNHNPFNNCVLSAGQNIRNRSLDQRRGHEMRFENCHRADCAPGMSVFGGGGKITCRGGFI